MPSQKRITDKVIGKVGQASRRLPFLYRSIPIFWSLAKSQFWSLVRLCVSICFLLFFPFFKLDASSSRALFYQSASVAYPQLDPRISVVVATDTSLRDGYTWPPSATFHAHVLKGLAVYKPRAVFFDMIMVDDRSDPGLPLFIEALENLKSGGALIYFAIPSAQSSVQRFALPDIERLSQNGTITLVASDFKEEGDLSVYPLSKDHRGINRFAVSAYTDLCNAEWISGCRPIENADNMEVWWGAPPTRVVCEQPSQIDKCEKISNFWLWRLFRRGAQELSSWLNIQWIDETHPITMSYHPQIDAYAVITERLFPRDRQALRESIIVYGQNFGNASDTRAHTSVYGSIVDGKSDTTVPGYYMHAMALDNLITLKGDYISSKGINSLGRFALLVLLPVLLAYLLLIFCQTIIAYPRKRFSDRPRHFYFRHYLFFSIIFTFFYVPISFFWLRQSPSLLLSLALAPFAAWQFESGFLGQWLSALFFGRTHKTPV